MTIRARDFSELVKIIKTCGDQIVTRNCVDAISSVNDALSLMVKVIQDNENDLGEIIIVKK